MQFQSDILRVDVQRPEVTETTALGAAYLAGLAVNFWDSKETIAKRWAMNREFKPEIENDERVKLYDGWKRAIGRAKGWEEA
jgi:glycerol kinase